MQGKADRHFGDLPSYSSSDKIHFKHDQENEESNLDYEIWNRSGDKSLS